MKRTHIFKQSEMLFLRFHRKLNFWAISGFLQYFTYVGGQKNGRIERLGLHQVNPAKKGLLLQLIAKNRPIVFSTSALLIFHF